MARHDTILLSLPLGMKARLKELSKLKSTPVNTIICRQLQELLELYNLWPLLATPDSTLRKLRRHPRSNIAPEQLGLTAEELVLGLPHEPPDDFAALGIQTPCPDPSKPWESLIPDPAYAAFLKESQELSKQVLAPLAMPYDVAMGVQDSNYRSSLKPTEEPDAKSLNQSDS